MNNSGASHNLLWFAIVLVVIWLVLRFALAITGFALHIIWVIGIILFVLWLINLMRGRGGPTV